VGEGLMDRVPVVVVPGLQVGPLAVEILHEFLSVVRVAVLHLWSHSTNFNTLSKCVSKPLFSPSWDSPPPTLIT
jgi:hypothetical protein